MKFYSATRIHNGKTFETEKKVLAFDDAHVFIETRALDDVDPALVQHFEGTLAPGFVNAHCHLELSHTKNLIPERTGLVDFLSQVMSQRAANADKKNELISAGFESLYQNACIAVGDIANSTDTLEHRLNAPFHIHTFVETMGFAPEFATARFDFTKKVYLEFANAQTNKNGYKLSQSIVPHAPYSVSNALFSLIDTFQKDSLISIHNEECAAENEYFHAKKGDMKRLYQQLNINDDWFKASGKNSLPSYLPYLKNAHPIILVHNTFMDATDIEWLHQSQQALSICLCPNANLYIEDRLPDVTSIAASGLNICLGTDSLASNHQLDIYAEVKTLLKHFPKLGEEQVLSWATYGGAKALQLQDTVGQFLNGLKPGLALICGGKAKRIF